MGIPSDSKKATVWAIVLSISSASLDAAEVEDASAELQELFGFLFTPRFEHRGQHDGQATRVIEAEERGQFVTDVMRGPVLWHALSDQAVERKASSPHQVGSDVVVGQAR